MFKKKKEGKIEEKRSLEKSHVFEARLPAFLTALKKYNKDRSEDPPSDPGVEKNSRTAVHIHVHSTPFVSQVQGKIMMNLFPSIQSVSHFMNNVLNTFSLVNDFIHSSLLIS